MVISRSLNQAFLRETKAAQPWVCIWDRSDGPSAQLHADDGTLALLLAVIAVADNWPAHAGDQVAQVVSGHALTSSRPVRRAVHGVCGYTDEGGAVLRCTSTAMPRAATIESPGQRF